jgi:dTDP-glucose pyrophosphorylase
MIEIESYWRRSIINHNSTIHDAVKNLNDVSIKITMVVDGFGKLLGTVSDGDIRRGLLRGLNLSSKIVQIIQKNPLVVPEGVTRNIVLQLMTANKLQQIPVVDKEGRPAGIHLWDEITATPIRSNIMVIMAGGLGIRLQPYTKKCPKPMLKLDGRPMLEHIIMRAKDEGFTRFLLSINYLGHMIEEYFSNGSKFGVEIGYLKEESALGTAGSLSLIDPLPDSPIVVTNGDVISNIHYGELLDFHCQQGSVATMAVRLHEWQHPFGVVQLKGIEIVGFEEKPLIRSHINAGVYALDPEALTKLERGCFCDMPNLFERLMACGKSPAAYPMHESWLDVGRPEDLGLVIKRLGKE